ncbi:GNAT family N-acetyltransferase [Luteibacter yeojuensis]|uniref:N-acetyltransferase domain-containing protein n=1 Tax=Luteibacter yeojuensis TaxID=345309 RepID=A0A7X5QT55_9GAMM|nr:hypothetical protein [Luteibacter yeojuensis]NID14961.1 hypothetical protein [Luteibacter yeojuensis]
MTITVRLAGLEDLTRLVILGRVAHGASNYRDIPFNAGHTRDMFRGAVLLKGQDVLIAERADGSLCGFLIAMTIELPFSPRKYATDGAFYAEQGGDVLLDAFVEWARKKHVARIDLSVSQDDPGDRIDHLYQRKGLARTGGMYLMKIPLETKP